MGSVGGVVRMAMRRSSVGDQLEYLVEGVSEAEFDAFVRIDRYLKAMSYLIDYRVLRKQKEKASVVPCLMFGTD